jgi:hypothetical protein
VTPDITIAKWKKLKTGYQCSKDIIAEMIKKINGFSNYTIDLEGNIYSLLSKKYLKPWLDKKGYLTIELRDDNGNAKSKKVHRLVAETFIPNPDNLPEVNHKDENKQNPKVDNLEWCTSKYNSNYGTRKERLGQSIRNSEIKKRKAILQFDLENNFIREYDTIERVKDYGFCQPNVIAVLKGRRKHTGGYIFKYKEDVENELSYDNVS